MRCWWQHNLTSTSEGTAASYDGVLHENGKTAPFCRTRMVIWLDTKLRMSRHGCAAGGNTTSQRFQGVVPHKKSKKHAPPPCRTTWSMWLEEAGGNIVSHRFRKGLLLHIALYFKKWKVSATPVEPRGQYGLKQTSK